MLSIDCIPHGNLNREHNDGVNEESMGKKWVYQTTEIIHKN